MLLTDPAVYAVGNNYQIMVPVSGESLLSVQIGNEEYFDEANGVMRSLSGMHRVIVPMDQLDFFQSYTIRERELIERKPYFATTRPIQETTYSFHPIPEQGPIRAYHISDAHNLVEEPVSAAKAYGPIDFLILNGDLPDHSGKTENFTTIYEIAGQITHGEIPIIFARGNHDLRGFYAEKIADYTPNQHGNTYYTFRLGPIWGIILDCGEDKNDNHEEYGFTVACHSFRKRQTAFLKNVIAHEKEEYQAEGIRLRLVLVHNPFTHQLEDPFAIEENLYRTWASLLKTYIHPSIMICGHLHELRVSNPGSDFDHLGQPCPVVIASLIQHKTHYYAGTGFCFDDQNLTLTYTDCNGKILGKEKILLEE